MKLSKNQVKHVAKLANLPISDEELEKYSQQLSKILDYIDLLNKVDTKNLEPLFNVTGLENILREDEISEGLTQEEALQNASSSKDGYFTTKGVFEE